jgi:rare lipoprotein A
MQNFYSRAFNIWLLLLTLSLFALSVNSIGPKTSKVSVKRENLALANSVLSGSEKKMLRMGLKRSHRVSYSKASWYGAYFHGRTTANMEIFNKNLLTAAHKTLPLNTYLLVTNLNNGKEVIVRVNDRGPYITGREIDLSEAAARHLGSHARGVVPIRYEILEQA